MPSPSSIITLGYGATGSPSDILTLGYGSAGAVDLTSRRGVVVSASARRQAAVVPARPRHTPTDAVPAGPPYQPR